MVTQKCRHLGMVRLITVTDVLVGCREDYRGDDQIEAMEQVKTQATIGCTLTKGERSVLD